MSVEDPANKYKSLINIIKKTPPDSDLLYTLKTADYQDGEYDVKLTGYGSLGLEFTLLDKYESSTIFYTHINLKNIHLYIITKKVSGVSGGSRRKTRKRHN